MSGDTEDSLSGMSRADTLRGFVAERLSAVSREIFAAVDVLVAAYEEEASGFREEMSRQRRQLELLQPQVSVHAAGGKCRPEEEEEEEEEKSCMKSPDSSAPARSSLPQCRRAQRKPGRPPAHSIQDTLDLRVHVLEDAQVDLLSKNAMKKCPIVKLTCPRGLQEADFLELLRSSVPRLTGPNKPFDVLISDKRRRLKPLKLTMVTPEEIHQHVRTGLGTAAVHIWLRTRAEAQEDIHPPWTENSSSAMLTYEDTDGQTSSPVGDNEDIGVDHVTIRSPQEEDMETAGEDRGMSGPDNSSEDVQDKEEGSSSRKPDGSEESTRTENPDDHQKHRCNTCHRVFELEEQLKAHHRTHTKGKTYLCGICGKFLSNNRSLTRHKKSHSAERPHRCRICGRGFKLPTTLKQHEKIHTDRERLYLCDVCCKMFLTGKQLAIHMRTHTNEKPYHCHECGKGFTTKGPLTVHMRVHTGETPYRCPHCGWSFKRKTHLDNHIAVHTGARPYICSICGKTCARKTYLTVHMRTHNGERPYRCSVCDKAFTQSHCLKTHMKSHQEGAQVVV